MNASAAGDGTDVTALVHDAACLILIDRSDADARVLMGRRLATQVFLPNKWVFPGGRLDDADHARAAAMTTAASTDANGHLPYVLASVRETFEEAGLSVCNTGDSAAMSSLLYAVKPLARAITPPGFPRRFDTWFYFADWNRSRTASGTPDGELLDLAWFTLAEVAALDLPTITRLIVDDVATVIANGGNSSASEVPFYFQAVDGYARTLISPTWPWPQP